MIARDIIGRVIKLWDNQSGATAIITAIVFPIMIGAVALSVEYGGALVTRAETQRVADIASYSAALAYTQNAGDQNSNRAAAIDAANNIALLNGISANRISLTFEQGDESGTDAFIYANIESSNPLYLARILDDREDLDIKAVAVSQIGQSKNSVCALAINPQGSGIKLSGSASILGNSCAIASNAAVTLGNCYGQKTAITADAIFYDTLDTKNCTLPFKNSEGEEPDLIEKQTEDPLSGDARVVAAKNEMSDLANLAPAEGGSDLTIVASWENPDTRSNIQSLGCSGQYQNSKWTITCPGETLSLKRLRLDSGSAEIKFQSGSGSISISDGIFVAGAAELILPPANMNIARSSGLAVDVSGSGTLMLGRSDTVVSEINIVGNVSTKGNSCIILGAATKHRIDGSVEIGGAAVFGRGIYALSGALDFTKGSNRTCDGINITAQGIGVTFILGGESGCGKANGGALCVGGGQANIRLDAPASGIFQDMLIVGPLNSGQDKDIILEAGGNGTTLSGVIYAPNSEVNVSGNATIRASAGGCVQLLAAAIDVSGSGSIELGDCLSGDASGPGGNTAVRLVR